MAIGPKVRDAGSWKPIKFMYVRDGGAWKLLIQGKVRDAGSWKLCYDNCDSPPTIGAVSNDLVAGDCSGVGHQTKASFSTTGELKGQQIYEYELNTDSAGYVFHTRTTSKTHQHTTQCGTTPFGDCSHTFQWRVRVVENKLPFRACTSFVTSSQELIEGDNC